MNPDIIKTAEKIEEKIFELQQAREQIIEAAQDKAKAVSEYDKSLAVTILRLKNNDIRMFEGQEISNLPATLIGPVAKGIVYEKAFTKELCEDTYKSRIVQMDAIRAELNGLQSINKYIE